jgi:hypothetical protein
LLLVAVVVELLTAVEVELVVSAQTSLAQLLAAGHLQKPL